jgi:hypothetical protein
MRCVFAVGSDAGWPVEVWALFSTEVEARRHAAAAAYEFTVVPLPVYDSRDDFPTPAPAGCASLKGNVASDGGRAGFARLIAAGAPDRPPFVGPAANRVGPVSPTCSWSG